MSGDDNQQQGAAADRAEPTLQMLPSRQFADWLADEGISLAFTTYQAGKVFLIGTQGQPHRLAIFERTLERCMGMARTDNGFFVSTLYQIWRFENALGAGELAGENDRVYVPQQSFVTGDIDTHDMAIDRDLGLIFVNTLFSCLATPGTLHSFHPIWMPRFISRLAAEDRCHLNGLAMRDGKPAFVTAVSVTDVADAWRDHRRGGGVVVDVDSNEVAIGGLSMPHSPRWHNGRLWLHNSGTGEFGVGDLQRGSFEPVCFAPGYLRGLDFHGDYAVLGLSNTRESGTFKGLELDDRLREKAVEPRCAIQIVDLRTGDVVHWLRIEGVVRELYDVMVLPGVRRPSLIGFKSDEIRRVISVGERKELAS